MTIGSVHLPVPWKVQHLASSGLPDTIATFRSDLAQASYITVTGTCPTCQGGMKCEWPKDVRAVTGSDVVGQSWGGGPITWNVVVECTCGHEHTGRADKPVGCGTSIMLDVDDD